MSPPDTSTDIAIRPVGAADRADWAALWTAYLDFYETAVGEDVYNATFARLLADDAPVHGLLAIDAGRPVGLCHYLFHPHTWRIAPVTYLQDLYTAPAARGRGAGTALIEAVYAAADAAGAPQVYWTTQHFNHTARSLYDRIGELTPFIKYQRRPA